MIRNWILMAFRSFRKNATSSAINIFGLTIGLSSCLLIALYIRHEISYDAFQTKGDRIARVIMEYRFGGGGAPNKGNFTSTKVAPTFKRTFPEIESAARMSYGNGVVGYEDKLFREGRFYYADSSFFDLFNFPMLEGDRASALSGPYKIILTQSTARKYFGGTDPVGKVIRVGTDSVNYLVTGIMADCPSNSQIQFDLLASFSSLFANDNNTYWDANYTTYLLLKSPQSFGPLQSKINSFMKKEMKNQGAEVNFELEPFRSIHLHSPYGSFEPTSSMTYIYILAGVALLILIIACSTYINLSTARSIERAREVGVRKVVGAGKGQLFGQFIGESLLFCLLAMVLSLGVALLALPAFNQLTGRTLLMSDLFSLPFLGMSLLIAVLVSFIAGSYPALVLAAFQPVRVLKGSFKNTGSGKGLRQSLIIFQFVISVFLIVSTFVMQGQLSYIQHKKLGYDRDHVLVLPMSYKMQPQIDYIKALFRSNPNVLSVSQTNSTPVDIHGGYNYHSANMSADRELAVTANPVDQDFIKTAGLQIVAGEDLVQQDIWDAHPDEFPGKVTNKVQPVYHFILNESAARELGWTPQEAIGKRMWMSMSRPGIVKGVVKDFHFESLHHAIRPLVLFPALRANRMMVKLSGEHLSQTIADIESKWKTFAPYMPFAYSFLDDDFNKVYQSEQRLGQVMNLFAAIAIVLACLGLFGLSSYAAKQRIKEIGIRKVLGASLPGLVVLLSKNFIRLAAVAILVAFPLAWWAMTKWLQDFIYRVDMDWKVYLLAGLLVLSITLITVSIQAVKTALINPVKNLKVE
ncbi:MAG TPA: ABC transporter permease [Puia sp.]|nr:ABC transporter permease [Puia sp.]